MEAVLVRKPSNREALELVDSECFYLGSGSSQCVAPAEHRCPYRRFKTVVGADHPGGSLAGIGTVPTVKPSTPAKLQK